MVHQTMVQESFTPKQHIASKECDLQILSFRKTSRMFAFIALINF